MGADIKSELTLLVPTEEESCGEQGSVSTFLQSRIHESFTRAADQLYAMGLLTTEERIAISSCIGDALEAFSNIMEEKVPTAGEIEVPIEVAQEILRNAILYRRQGIIRLAQDEELGAPISSEYLDLPNRDQDYRTLRELIGLALIDEMNAAQHYDNMLEVVEQMDLPVDMDHSNRAALEEIFNDERDHEGILLRMLGEPIPEPGLTDVSYRLAKHSFDKCMRCGSKPTYEILWANGKGHAWFCEPHAKEFVKEHDANSVKKIDDGKARAKFADNTNGNILSEFRQTITAVKGKFIKKEALPVTEAEFFEELVRIAKDEQFRFDPNSTESEGRWRLMDPKVFVQGSVRRWNIWKEMKAPGIQFVMGQDTRDKQWKPQAVRFKKPDWDERKAAAWWEQNKSQFQREWTQTNWDEWMQKHPDEIAPDYAGKVSPEAIRTGQTDIPRTLAIDLDGTILEYDGFKGVGIFGSPIDGAREALQKFKEDGWFIVIDTCRGEVPQVVEHLTLFDIPFDSVNRHPFQPSTANPGKPMAEYRIDDSAIYFDGDWASVYDEIGRREHTKSLRAMKVVWKPPIEQKIALQELADDLSDREWLDVLPHTAEVTGESVALSRRVGMDTYRMIRCGGEYRAFRNFDPIYRSGGLFNEQELRESFEAAINSEDSETVESILNEYESCLFSNYRSHGFNNPERWINITGTAIDGDRRIIYVEADPRGFEQHNKLPVDDPQLLLAFLKRVADGAFAYDPRKYILLDFLDPFGNRAQPTDYPDPALWGNPEELKRKVRKRRQRDRGDRGEQPERMKAKRLLDILVKEKL